MSLTEHAREDVESTTNRVVDAWSGLLPAARLELRSASPTLAALVPALDALVRSVGELDRRQREYDAARLPLTAGVL